MKELIYVSPKLNDDEHKQLRDINANTSIVIENDSYLILGGGLNMMGTNILSSYYMTGNIKKFENIENELINKYNIKSEQIKLGFFAGHSLLKSKVDNN